MHEDTDQTPASYNPMIRDIPADMRPREQLIGLGAGALFSTELITYCCVRYPHPITLACSIQSSAYIIRTIRGVLSMLTHGLELSLSEDPEMRKGVTD